MTVYVGLYPMERSPQRQYIRLTTNIRVGRNDDVHHWEDLKEYRSELISGILLKHRYIKCSAYDGFLK